MKIICIGLPKTGTTSLHHALKIMGFQSVHFPIDKKTVSQLRAGDYNLEVLKKNDAVSDVPIPAVFPQLDHAFPGARFILTTRSIDSWIESERNAPFNSDLPKNGTPRDFYRSILYGVTAFSEERFRFVFNDHMRKVEEYFLNRPDDLLVMDITRGDGWEKLCPFLDNPEPDVEFPRSNVAKSYDNKSKAQNLQKHAGAKRAAPGTVSDPLAYARDLERRHADLLENATWRAMEPARRIRRWAKGSKPPRPFMPRLLGTESNSPSMDEKALLTYARDLETRHVATLNSTTWRAMEPVRRVLRLLKGRKATPPFKPRMKHPAKP